MLAARTCITIRSGITRSVLRPAVNRYCSDVDDHVTTQSFADFGVSERRVESLRRSGIEKMFPVQISTYPDAFAGRDMIARAKTGTGKTLAFVLPLIERHKDLRGSRNSPNIVILAPTRELALQVAREVDNIDPTLNTVTVYGGASMSQQQRQLSGPVDVVVGTPGRVIHFIQDGILRLDSVKSFVLDEADQMLDQGFRVEIEKILQEMPAQRQVLMFSATMPDWVKSVSRNHMNSPTIIDLIGENKTPDKVTHFTLPVSNDEQRTVAISLLLKENKERKSIIFVDTKAECGMIASERLICENTSIAALHGDIPQAERASILLKFRNGIIRTLVATDVASRGLDIPGVDLVINYRPPTQAESYIHRSGRGGRAGKLGSSIILTCGNEERGCLRNIERKCGKANFGIYEFEESQANFENTHIKSILSGVSAKSVLYSVPLAKEIIEDIGCGEKALAAAISLLQNEKSDSFSLMTGKKGFVSVIVESRVGQAYVSSVNQLLQDCGIKTKAIDTQDGNFVCDLKQDEVGRLHESLKGNQEFVCFPAKQPPLLRRENPGIRPGMSGGGGGRRRGGGGSSFGDRRGGDRGYGGDRRGGGSYGGDRRGGGSYGGDRGGDRRGGDRRGGSYGDDRGGDRRGGDRRGGSYGDRGGDRRGGDRGGRNDGYTNQRNSTRESLNFDFLMDD